MKQNIVAMVDFLWFQQNFSFSQVNELSDSKLFLISSVSYYPVVVVMMMMMMMMMMMILMKKE